MKSVIIAFVGAALASSLNAQPVNAAPKDGQRTNTGQTSNEEAMRTCEEMYTGNHGLASRDRYAYIERCFRGKTGKYPFQSQMNCSLRRC